MKTSQYNKELVAYALAFISFILPKIENIKEIILFGSVARGEADKDSDIDLFFDLESEKDEEKIKRLIELSLKKFYSSKIAETSLVKGLNNPIKANIGNLSKWKLKRSIISDGISLYAKYKEIPKNLRRYAIFTISPVKDIAKRNKIIRKLFGRKEKNYNAKGIIEELKGKRLSTTGFIIPLEHSKEILELLSKEKIDYSFFEFWTDKI